MCVELKVKGVGLCEEDDFSSRYAVVDHRFKSRVDICLIYSISHTIDYFIQHTHTLQSEP